MRKTFNLLDPEEYKEAQALFSKEVQRLAKQIDVDQIVDDAIARARKGQGGKKNSRRPG